MSENEPEMTSVLLMLKRRPDGGLRVWSPNLPGLKLSHSDADLVYRDIGPAIQELLKWSLTPSKEPQT